MADREPLVGREDVVGLLRDRLLGIRDQGCAVGLIGEAGVGKSSLQAAAVDEARAQGFTVLRARGSESETHLPFASLHQVLRPVLTHAAELPARQRDALLSGFGMTDTTAADPFLMSLAALELVAESARTTPVLVSLDDVQWMDEPSVDVLGFMARRIQSEQIMILASGRPGATPMADDPSIEWLPVTGLDAAAAAALVAEHAPDLAPDLRDRVLREAGGNPLALLEFPVAMRSGRFGWTELSDELPMTTRLERAFVSRVEHLPALTRTFLTVAALDDGTELAEMFAATAVLAGRDADLDAGQPALDAGLVDSDGTAVQFRHPLVRSALRHSMTLTQRQAVHGALAEVLAGTYPDRAAWHRASAIATADEAIAAGLEAAARSAARRGALGSAVLWLQRAAALSPDPAVRGGRLLGAAELAFELGRFAQVEQLKKQVARTALEPRDRSRLIWLEGAFDDGSAAAPAELRRLIALAGDAHHADDPDLALQLLIGAARRVWWGDPGDAVRDELVAAVTTAAPAEDPRRLAVLALSGSHELGAGVLERVAAWGPATGGPPEVAALLGVAAFCAGDHARTLAFLSSPLEDLRTQGRLSLLAEALTIRAWAAVYEGDFDLARCADEAMRLAGETGRSLWGAIARIAIAALDAVRGTHDSDHALLADAERAALGTPVPLSTLLACLQLARGLDELAAARYDAAYAQLRRVFDPADPAHHRVQQVWTLGYLVDASVPTGRVADARDLLAEIERVAGPRPSPASSIALEYARAVLAHDADADALFRAALDGAARQRPWHRARAELAYGSWLRRHRRVVESRELLRSARDTFETLGARAWAERTDQELRATGERGWQPGGDAREVLSPQESEIAHLAAGGLSNREIAQRLYLSHRTVGSHLYRIFPKLGITSRTQLGAALGARAGA